MSDFDLFTIDVEGLRGLLVFLGEKLPSTMARSQYFALNELGRYIENQAFDFIVTGGEGWEKRSKVANIYTTAPQQNNVVFRKKLSQSAAGRSDRRFLNDEGMIFIMKYFRWKVETDGQNRSLFVDFGGSSRQDVDYLINQVQVGAEITVTDKMRRAFSFTEFPLKKETRTIKIPAREIGKPLFRRTSGKYFVRFVDEFVPNLMKELNAK